jgi:Tol biopolymer transport system component
VVLTNPPGMQRGWPGLKHLTDNQAPDQRALAGGYSPNGKWIVFRQESGDQSALMVMRTGGQGMHAIIPFSDFRPRFIDWGPVPS